MILLLLFRNVLTVLFILLHTSTPEKHHHHKCFHQYATEFSSLTKVDLVTVLSLLNKTSSVPLHNSNGISMYHIGHAQSRLDLDVSMNQLNVSTNVDGKMYSHCLSSATSSDRGVAGAHVMYYGSVSVSSLEYLVGLDSARFVFSASDCSSSQSYSFPIAIDDSVPNLKASLENVEIVRKSWQMYQTLIQCIIPQRNLLILNSTITGNSDHYWKTLVSFLGLSPSNAASAVDTIVPERTLQSLIKAGVPTMRNGRSCYMNGHVCMYTKINDKSVIVPSVCSLAENIDLVHVTHPRVIDCARSYVSNLTALFGEKYRKVLLDKLLKPVLMTMYDTKADIILNIGPGSTGTRSLHMAMRQLNVTASHYRMSSSNCECLLAKDGTFVFEGKQLTLDPVRVFWGTLS